MYSNLKGDGIGALTCDPTVILHSVTSSYISYIISNICESLSLHIGPNNFECFENIGHFIFSECDEMLPCV